MTKRRFTPAYPAELRERGVRLFQENRTQSLNQKLSGKPGVVHPAVDGKRAPLPRDRMMVSPF